MVHLDNVPHILKYGITHKNSKNANSQYIPIGDSSLISTRNNHAITENKVIGDYIPFYFAIRTPMLYVIQKGFNGVQAVDPAKIVYVVISLESLIQSKSTFIYTDGHATDNFSSVFNQAQIDKLEEQLDFKAINAKYWRNEEDLDLKRRKEAELLVENDIPYNHINGFVVFDNDCKNNMLKFGIPKEKIHINKNYYFE